MAKTQVALPKLLPNALPLGVVEDDVLYHPSLGIVVRKNWFCACDEEVVQLTVPTFNAERQIVDLNVVEDEPGATSRKPAYACSGCGLAYYFVPTITQ